MVSIVFIKKEIMIRLQNISYTHPDKDVLFTNINLSVKEYDKIALIGKNGSGKSTLLKIIANELQYTEGQLSVDAPPYYIPQLFQQYDHFTISQAWGVDHKLKALEHILNGNASEKNFEILADDWTIQERCTEALRYWELGELNPDRRLASLSGGQKMLVFLAGIIIHQPPLVLMDEPSNHLDASARQLLYQFIVSARCTLVVVTHDRKLLDLLPKMCELTADGIKVYGGNYSFYSEQKEMEKNALDHDVLNKEKALRKAKEKERETAERRQKLDARGKGKQEKAGVAKIMMNTLRNSAENSTAKLKNAHTEKIEALNKDLQHLRASVADIDKIKFGFDNSRLHTGKVLFSAKEINFCYGSRSIWKEDLSFQVTSGERIALKGNNGSGKTTLIKIILGELEVATGSTSRANNKTVYIDQGYSLIDGTQKVYEQAELFNNSGLQEHEIKIRLNRFLFAKDYWDKPCSTLSGGERMRLLLCCLTINIDAPDIIILDEPTNNLDIQNIEILTMAINEYRGTLIVVAHDDVFLEQINTNRTISL